MTSDLGRRLTAEAIGTAILLAAVVGSGIMADRLSGGNGAIALLANTLATAAALVALILTSLTLHSVGSVGESFLPTSWRKSWVRSLACGPRT